MSQKKILFFTNAEHGQANVVLATAHELLKHGCEIQIASFASNGTSGVSSMAERTRHLSEGAFGILPAGTKPVIFHPIDGVSMGEALFQKCKEQSQITHGTGVHEAIRMMPLMVEVLSVWPGEEYVKSVESCVEIIKKVDPDVIVNDRACAQGIDACDSLRKRWICISPNTFKETISIIQPYLFGLWGVPVYVSGFKFPVPWHQRPLNIYIILRTIIGVLRSGSVKKFLAYRKSHGLTSTFPFLEPYNKNVHYLIPSTPECDFKFPYIPPNITACGPILHPSPPLSEVDPDLEQWLKLKPTVLISMGSNFIPYEKDSEAIASAIRTLTQSVPGVQVLWKFNYKGRTAGKVPEILKAEIENGIVKTPSWLKAEPNAILSSGYICCSVHHGGANSFFEAVNAGVPQIVLPQWFDTFDFAQRVEYLAIGINASKTSPPSINANEFGSALVKIVGGQDPEGVKLAQGAKNLGRVMEGYGGRKAAADKILELAGGEEFSLHA